MGDIASGATFGARYSQLALGQQFSEHLAHALVFGRDRLFRKNGAQALLKLVHLEPQQFQTCVDARKCDVGHQIVGVDLYLYIIGKLGLEMTHDVFQLFAGVAVDHDVPFLGGDLFLRSRFDSFFISVAHTD